MRSLLHFPDKFDHGMSTLAGPHLKKDGTTFTPTLGLFAPFQQVLATPFHTDAHCVFYCLREADGTLAPCPLLRKSILPDIKAAGCEVVTTGFGLDFDTVGHVPLDDDHLAALYEKLSEAWDKDPRLANWAAWYTTRHGARVVYMLTEPVPATEGEGRLITLQRAYKTAGIEPDPLVDWTRRFRLPLVLRDGIPTGQERLHMCEVAAREIPVRELPPSARKTLARLRTFTPTGDYPNQEECHKRLYQVGKSGRETRTRFHDRALKSLRETPLYATLFDGVPLPDEGRHEWLLNAFGLAVPKLLRYAYASAEDIFALFYEPILQWDPATCRQDPHAHAWDILQHIYANEIPLYNREQEEVAEKAATSESVLHGMIEGMRTWCDSPDLGDDMPMETREAFVKRHIFANMESFYYPMNRHGYYSSMCRSKDQLIPYIRTSHLSGIIETRKLNKDGVLVSVAATEIVNDHTTIVDKTKAKPQMASDGYIEAQKDKRVLVLPMYRRNPALTAQYDAQVDGWLRAFFGKGYDLGARWIGYSLDFEGGPVCALSLDSVPSSGKKLLVSGLSECLQDPVLLQGNSIGDKHAAELMESPFVNVNEAWPEMESFSSPSERFKQVVAGDDISVEPKFKGKIIINNPLRIVMTANGDGLINSLVAGQNMTPAQRESVGIRLMHLKVAEEAVRYLWSIGGMGGTTQPGRRWIRGDGGEPSDYIVARHFLWLYENRPDRDVRERFVVMGNCGDRNNEAMELMSGRSDDMPKVYRGLLEILGSAGMFHAHMAVVGARIGVTRDGILGVIRGMMEEKIREGDLENCLSAIAVTLEPMVVKGREYVEVDVDAVLRYGRKWGKDITAAEKLVKSIKNN